MLHLDEGTIHAWLDGELSPEESESAARHVAECAQCREAVTEARGFMAGATRIVSALDAGPAGVVPRTPRSPAPLGQPWYRILTPARMSIAATIVVAVGLSITARRVADNSSPRGRLMDSPMNVARPTAASAVSVDSVSVAREKQKALSANLAAKTWPIMSAKEDAAHAPARLAARSPTVGVTAAAERASAVADKRTVADSETRIAAASPAPAQAPAARFDSTHAAKDEMAKIAVDSNSRAQALARRQAFVSGNVNQLSEVVTTGARDADLRNFVVFPQCYRLAIDSTEWRGILPEAFILDPASPQRVNGSAVAARMRPAAAGAAGGAAPKATAQSTSDMVGFSGRVVAAGAIRALALSGRVDSTIAGIWSAMSRDSITLRFMTDPKKPVTLLLGATGSIARLTSGGRADSVRVARTSCSR